MLAAHHLHRTGHRRRAALGGPLPRRNGAAPALPVPPVARWSFDKVSPFERQRTLDPGADPKLVNQGLTKLAEHYPALKGLQVARSWGGLIDSTPDGIPVISAVAPMPGLYLSTGYTGHGFGIGPGAGRLAADIVAGDPPIVDPHPFRYSRMIDDTDLGAPGMM